MARTYRTTEQPDRSLTHKRRAMRRYWRHNTRRDLRSITRAANA